MSQITSDDCNRCDLETVNDPHDSQYVWINWRDLENKTNLDWRHIFNKYKDSSTQKRRIDLIPNTMFQHHRLFVRNDFFEKIIMNYGVASLETLNLEEKLGLCNYDNIPNWVDKNKFKKILAIADNSKISYGKID